MRRFCNTVLLAASLMVPVAINPAHLFGQDHDRDKAERARSYHDRDRNDDHEWNNHEDRAYRMWAKENHRKYRDFDRLKDDDRQNYWNWRHSHSDADLHIDIR